MCARERFTGLVREIYSENYTSFIMSDSASEFIELREGVKQGCPLSGLLFNVTMDSVLRAIPANPEMHNILAYADDVMLMADTPGELQEHVNTFSRCIGTIGLKINPKKFFTMHLAANTRGCRPTSFTVDGVVVPHIFDG